MKDTENVIVLGEPEASSWVVGKGGGRVVDDKHTLAVQGLKRSSLTRSGSDENKKRGRGEVWLMFAWTNGGGGKLREKRMYVDWTD